VKTKNTNFSVVLLPAKAGLVQHKINAIKTGTYSNGHTTQKPVLNRSLIE